MQVKSDAFRPTLNNFVLVMMSGKLPVPILTVIWTRALTEAMNHTSKGHRLNAISRHTGKTYWNGDDFIVDRRADKLERRFPKALRQWNSRTGSKPNEV